jgi:hypothetical protein
LQLPLAPCRREPFGLVFGVLARRRQILLQNTTKKRNPERNFVELGGFQIPLEPKQFLFFGHFGTKNAGLNISFFIGIQTVMVPNFSKNSRPKCGKFHENLNREWDNWEKLGPGIVRMARFWLLGCRCFWKAVDIVDIETGASAGRRGCRKKWEPKKSKGLASILCDLTNRVRTKISATFLEWRWKAGVKRQIILT